MKKKFWEMSAEERRTVLKPDAETPYSTNTRDLARLWADCDEDEILMRVKYADEIQEINRRMDMTIHKVRMSAKIRKLGAEWTIEIPKITRVNSDG